MTYLELVKELVSETGTENPDEITDVTALETQHQSDAKRWIDRAYREIQLMDEDWEFRRGDLEVSLVAGTRSYSLTAAQADFETLLPYYSPYGRPWAILDDQRYNPVWMMEYQDWRGWIEAQSDHEGRPRWFTVDPNDNLLVYPKPRNAYTFKASYSKQLDTLTANGDEPILPARFHDVIVFFALKEYAGFDTASSQYQRAHSSLKRTLNKLMIDELPQTRIITPSC